MTLHHIVYNLKRELIRTFAVLDAWFDSEEEILHYKPPSSQFTIADVLHRTEAVADLYTNPLQKISFNEHKLVDRKVFEEASIAYTFITPSIIVAPVEVISPLSGQSLMAARYKLREALNYCLYLLEELEQGKGIMYKLSMPGSGTSVNLYQYTCALVLEINEYILLLQKLEPVKNQTVLGI